MVKPQPKPAQVSRKRPLSRARVLAAAIALADRSGIEQVSMRSLATKLRVEAMSLYHHVANKDALLDAMVDTVVAQIALPSRTGSWIADLRTRAASIQAVMNEHPWASLMILSRVNVGPAMLRLVDATVGCLVSAGFTYPQADRIWSASDAYLFGSIISDQQSPIKPEEYASAASGFLPLLEQSELPHLLALTRLVAQGSHDGRYHLLDGYEAVVSALGTQVLADAK